MAQIDLYVHSLAKYGATAVVLASGKPVTLRFPTGDRNAAQVTQHNDLVNLVGELATPPQRAALLGGGKLVLGHEVGGKAVSITVEPRGPAAWVVTITPGAPAAEVGPPGVEDLIERHHYEEEARPAPAPAPASVPPPPRAAPPSASISASPPVGTNRIDKLLLKMRELGASDLHLSTGNPPVVRVSGEIRRLNEFGLLEPEALQVMIDEIAPEKNKVEFGDRNDTDFAYALPGISRFRVNVFRDRFGPGAVLRAIPFEILSPEQLGLPKTTLDLCYLTKGLVVVTGPTGSGKSTTLATLIDYVNKNRKDHIITIEDPIEFVHENKQCLINQREVHQHTRSFKDALRAALREDPNIVLVGEMRDLETIAIAVETAETGHLVFGTLHTTTAPSTVDRIIDQFPADRQDQIRQMLAESLRGVIAQTLCKKVGGGRVAAYEILLANSAVANLIRDKKTFQLPSLMQTSRAQGMITLNDSLMEFVRKGVVEPREAYMKAVNKGEFKGLLAKEGFKTGIGDDTDGPAPAAAGGKK